MNPKNSTSAPELDASGKLIRRAAAEWLARREAGELTPAAEHAFRDWLAADARHAAIFAQVESSWRAFDTLAFYPHPVEGAPNPNFFAAASNALTERAARSSPWPLRATAVLAFAAAAGLAVALWIHPGKHPRAPDVAAPVAQASTRFLHLPDQSEVELNAGSEVVEHFTPGERRVRLVRGEAHFTVTKNPNRPFIVEAGGVAVRAVGTAFDVRLGATVVEVLVTEGTVQVHPPGGAAAGEDASNASVLTVGQRTIVPAVGSAAKIQPVIETLAAADIDRALAWETARLVFDNTPLSEVVSRFNQHSAGEPGAPRLVVDDAQLGALRISGRIRSDSLDSFVEALETSFAVAAEHRPDGEIVLRRSP